MAKPDEAHLLTDMELSLLEKRIKRLYKEAADELQATVEEYFKELEERDKHQQELLEAGKITERQYIQWRLAQIGRGKRFEALRNLIAYRYTNANALAVAYANDSMAGIYALNRNYITWEMQQKGYDTRTWAIFDEHTVKRLVKDEPDLMPYYPPAKALKRGIDLDYGCKRITASVTSGILQGLSIGKIADKLQRDMESMSRASAIRTARTAVTEAQNAGRQDGFKTAADMGIKAKKEWVATKDGRTRHAHGAADSQIVAWDEPFMVGGYPMMYPGDKSAPGHLVYNCRCRMVSATDRHLEAEPRMMRVRDPATGKNVLVEKQSYSEWLAANQAQNPEATALMLRKGKNYSADKKQWEEYRTLLGNNVPSNLDAFQNMKYNDTEKWEYLKSFAAYKRANPEGNVRFFEANEAVTKLRNSGTIKSKGTVVKAPPPIIINDENDHAKGRQTERNISREDAQSYIDNAKFALKQQKGNVYAFYTEQGFSVVDVNGNLRTTGHLNEGGKIMYDEVMKYVERKLNK